jgi:hypothetical protein
VTEQELQVAIAFARLELLELEAHRRSLIHCPGLKLVGKAIAEAERESMRKAAEAVKG